MSEKNNIIIVVLAFSVVGFMLYGNTLNNEFVWDDPSQIVGNEYVKDFDIKNIFQKSISAGSGRDGSFFRPIVSLSFAIDYQLWGENPAGYHFVNIILHILSALLVYLIFLSLQSNRIVAILTGVLFLIHPLQVESVAYISGRTDLMPVFFILLSLFSFIPVFYGNDKKHVFYALSLISFAFALLSKELAVIFPVLLVLVYFMFIEKKWNRVNIRYIATRTLPFFMLILGYVVLRMNALQFVYTQSFYQDFFGRVLSFFAAIFFYWGIIFVPHNLRSRFDYGFPMAEYGLEIIASILVLIVIIYLAIKLLRRNRNVFFGFSWFFIGLIPVSGIFFIPLISVAERWLRLPSIGIFYLVSIGIIYMSGLVQHKKNLHTILIVLFSIYIIFLSVVTIRANEIWENSTTFYLNALKYYPEEPSLHTNLAITYEKASKSEDALHEYRTAVSLEPNNPKHRVNLGNFYFNHGNIDPAFDEYKRAFELDKTYNRLYWPLVQIYVDRRQYDEAIYYLEQFMYAYPESTIPYSWLSQVYLFKGDYAQARSYLEKAIERNPEDEKFQKRLEELSNSP